MEETTEPINRPIWVRLVILRNSNRDVALTGLRLAAMTLVICLAIAGMQWNRDTVMGRVSFVSAVVGSCFMLGILILVWRAIRWQDRHGAWPRLF